MLDTAYSDLPILIVDLAILMQVRIGLPVYQLHGKTDQNELMDLTQREGNRLHKNQ